MNSSQGGSGRVIILKGRQKAVPLHAHHSLLIGMNLKGSREMFFGRKTVLISKKIPYVISAEAIHGSKKVEDEFFECVLVLADVEALSRYFPEISKVRFPVQSPVYETIIPFLKNMRAGDLDFQCMKKIWDGLKPAQCLAPETLDGRLVKARDFLAADIERNTRIEDLARSLGMSRYHFIRIFSAAYGVTPHAYRNILRVQNAKKLLKNGVAQAECAYSCGFADQSHLHRHFHRQVGFPPAQYS